MYFPKLMISLFVSFILVLTVFIEFLKNFNKQQFVNQRLTKSLEQYLPRSMEDEASWARQINLGCEKSREKISFNQKF